MSIDKIYHFIVGFVIGFIFCYFNYFLALGMALAAGVGKEAYDYVSVKYFGKSHSVEVMDAISTLGGGVLGVVVMEILKHLLN